MTGLFIAFLGAFIAGVWNGPTGLLVGILLYVVGVITLRWETIR